MKLHIGITGTRHGATYEQLTAFKMWLLRANIPDEITVHHGLCIGVDTQVHKLCKARGFRVHGHPTNSERLRGVDPAECDALEQPKPPLDRNKVIVNVTSILIAFPAEMNPQVRGGTWSTIRYWNAQVKNRRRVIIFPNGKVQNDWQ